MCTEHGRNLSLVSAWNTGNVVSFRGIFERAKLFHGNAYAWNTISAVAFAGTFQVASTFITPDGPLEEWQMACRESYARIFQDAPLYNSDCHVGKLPRPFPCPPFSKDARPLTATCLILLKLMAFVDCELFDSNCPRI